MIDQTTFERFEDAKAVSQTHGLALAEVLDKRALLLTPSRELGIQVQAVENVLRRLDRQSANKLMAYHYGRVDGTPAEMFTAVKMWLETVCQNLAHRTLDDL